MYEDCDTYVQMCLCTYPRVEVVGLSPAHMQFLVMIPEEYLQILTRFMSKAWQLDLDEIVCDFVQDHEHKLSVPVPTF